MSAKGLVGLVAGLVIWAVYFYAADMALMQAQGLPVTLDLMPK